MTLLAVVFVSSAWAVIYTAISSARASALDYGFDTPSSFSADTSQGCAFSMEMFPVSYIDEHGRRSTAWETDVRNCWGGLTRVSSLPSPQVPRGFGGSARAVNRY
ncbi:MAG TPA: hypothetical protein VIH91_07950 [Terriglobales bacterium]